VAKSKIQIAPERIAEGKQLYEMTLTPVPDIAALMGISRRTLERRIAEWGWTPRSAPRFATDRAVVALAPVAAAPVAALANADAGAAASNPVSPAARRAFAARIPSTVERGLSVVDRVLDKVDPSNQSEAERSARTLAAVARTLHEMAAFTKPDEVAPPDETDDDPVPGDLDELRLELARRLHALIDARSGCESGSGDGAAPAAATEKS
jgi:hypothetical protein